MKKKEFTFRGRSLEELQKMDTREFAKLLKSRARRTVLRQFQEIENFINRAKEKIEKGSQVKTHSRYLVIVPKMVGMKIGVYNGQKFNYVEITGEMLGHRLGEFSLTRARIKHSKMGVGATKGSRAKSKK